ncbi:MAG: NAD(P)H-quinone oxidoreductase subunit 5, partial [Akkermansiaceae bacterium]
SWTPSARPSSHPFVLISALLAAVGLTFAIGSLSGRHAADNAGILLLGSIFVMAIASFLWNLWSSSHRSSLVIWGLLITAATATAYFTLHTAFDILLADVVPPYHPDRSPAEFAVMILVGLAFMAVLILQAQLPAWSMSTLGRKVYVHASHGFYVSTIFNRLTLAVFRKKNS